jgi:glycosyltransferase involved in cell wall biosynthesis
VTLYFDISLARRHAGTPHGLARVEVSLVKEFVFSGASVLPIWLDDNWEICQGGQADFLDITDGSHAKTAAFANYEEKTNTVVHTAGTNLTSHIQNLKEISLLNRFITIGSYSVSLLPNRFTPIAIQIGKRVYRIFSKLKVSRLKKRSNLNYEPVAQGSQPPFIEIGLEDIVMMAGNDWDRRTYQRIGISKSINARYAFVVYDLIPYEYTNYSVDIDTAGRFTYWIGDIAQKASYLFFISKFSQDRFNAMLRERCIESAAKQMVISLPPGLVPGKEVTEPKFVKEIDKNFILVVCTIEARKNHQVLISALRLANSKNERIPQLVFIGSPGWGTENFVNDIRTDEKLKGQVVIKSGVSDAELRWLYGACTAVAYPSIVEGFGLPVFEAAVFKKPIITSDIPVFEEIPHPLRVKVNPYDTEGWKNALQNVGTQKEPNGGWQTIELPTWKDNVQKMMAFMADDKSN